ncbi:MAG TPA: hypothetical protein VFK41_07585 [Nocardioidaceae bacterium]|nr:hypothetical protein [Nocardioidaceae bacterium]
MDIDRVLASIAVRYHGLLPRFETRAAGIDWRVLLRRVGSGLLDELSPRVLRVAGIKQSDEQRVMAATLDVAGGAVASFETAAWLWRFPGFWLRHIEVTARRTQHRTSTLAFVHRPVLLRDHHVTVVRGIPVTSVARTIFDLAGVIHPLRLARLIDSVCTRSPAVLVQLHRLLPELAKQGRPGIRIMRELLQSRPVGIRVAPSGYQARFEEVMAEAGVTGLRREIDVGGHSWIGRVDYRCEVTGVLFEVDSALNHTSPTDVAADAERDAAALAAGFPEVVRIVAEDLYPRPQIAVAAVRQTRSRYRNRPDVVGSGTENAS